jgi:hypothetical protein
MLVERWWGLLAASRGLLRATFLVVCEVRSEGARVEAYALEAATTAFEESRERLETILAWLSGPESAGLTHAELEARLQVTSRELFCQLVQDHLDLRAQREPRLAEVVDADQVPRDTVEARRARTLATVLAMCGWNASPTVPAPTPTCTPLMPC